MIVMSAISTKTLPGTDFNPLVRPLTSVTRSPQGCPCGSQRHPKFDVLYYLKQKYCISSDILLRILGRQWSLFWITQYAYCQIMWTLQELGRRKRSKDQLKMQMKHFPAKTWIIWVYAGLTVTDLTLSMEYFFAKFQDWSGRGINHTG